MYWCPHDETALAEAEIEYQDDPCTTVYVKFRVKDDLGRLSQYGDLSNMYFVIWTTTIWTLPGNLAIAVHPRESYVLVKADNGELYIVAEALCAKVMQAGGFDHYEIVKQFRGQDFEYMKAQHPFLDKESLLCCAEYVTMDSGTGCVHTAPGFGADDYETCKRYKVELVVPVDDQGRHTDYAGKYAGLKTEESNPVILADLKESGALFASEEIVHSYPHCWRCEKTHHLPGHPPVVLFRGLLQGRGGGRLRRCSVAPCLGQGPDDLHDPGAGRLVHQPPAPLGPAHPGVLLRRLRQAHRHRRDH